MSGRQRAADDAEVISERLAASFRCTCVPTVAEDGSTDWTLTPDCPLHRVAAVSVAPVVTLAQRYPHWGFAMPKSEVRKLYCSCPVGPDGIVHTGGCELHRADGFTYTATLLLLCPKTRAELVARIRSSLAAAHFRVGR